MITEQLAALVEAALEDLRADGLLPGDADVAVQLERPRNPSHGDWSTNAAMLAAPAVGTNPRELAAALVDRIPPSDLVEQVEVAGPGFVNFRLSMKWLVDVVRRAAQDVRQFGRSPEGAGQRIDVEYVSANPTGPINVVSGRHAAVGDVIANLLEATGHEVTREFYVNDGGRQVELFARSLAARYLQARGIDAAVPEEGYVGDYVRGLATEIAAGSDLPEDEPALVEHMRGEGVARMVESMRASLERFGSRFDVWFSERTLHPEGVEAALRVLEDKGLTERREGALWFKASQLGDDKDRVLVRSNGDPTYLAPDLAYFADKFARGFDALIYLLGSDHHGTVARMLAGAEAMGFHRDRVEVLLVQIVNLRRGGTLLKGSKRQGVIVPLDELVDEVGVDAARYTFLTRSLDSPLDFDIDLVKEQAPENPVYYVQYAHARICSILRKAATDGLVVSPPTAPVDQIHHPSELDLARKIAEYEEVVPDAARRRAPHRITRYVEELGSDFSAFYRDCKVMTEDPGLTSARLALCVATKNVLSDGLGLLGVSAPERM